MDASNGTLTYDPLPVFIKLYRVLLCAVVVIAAFFGSYLKLCKERQGLTVVVAVISSISFSSRLDEDYAPDTWKTRWCKHKDAEILRLRLTIIDAQGFSMAGVSV